MATTDLDSSAPICFPASLRAKADTGMPHVRFMIAAKSGEPPGASVHLFIPMGFSVPDAAAYTSIDLGITGGLEAIMKADKTLTEADAKGLMADMSGLAVSSLIPQAGGIGAMAGGLTRLRGGIASNPYTETQYTGSGIRSFGFTFKLVSENSKEADIALVIENFFRDNMYPESTGAAQLKYPERFKIDFFNGEDPNKFMPHIKECYLLSLQTTYNSTTNAFHDKGQPVEIDIALTFQEVKALTREELYAVVPKEKGEE